MNKFQNSFGDGLQPTAREQIENNFTYHPPSPEQVPLYNDIRDRAKLFAIFIEETCPNSRERALALTAIENSVFWANASIARNT